MILLRKTTRTLAPRCGCPGRQLGAVMKLALDLYHGLHETGALKGFTPPTGQAWQNENKLSGLDYWIGLEKKFVTG